MSIPSLTRGKAHDPLHGLRFLHTVQQQQKQRKHVACRIFGRSMQPHNTLVLLHLRRYQRVISTDMKCLICEWLEEPRTVFAHAPFLMKRVAQVLNCNIIVDMNYEIGKYRLHQKNDRTESSFAVQLSANACGILCTFMFHAVNVIGKLIANIRADYNCKGYDGDSAAQ